MPEENTTAKVLAHERLTESLRVLKVAAPQGLSFVPGQFTKIGFQIDGQPRPLMRAYSFVNTPNEEVLEFCYDVLYDCGNLTPKLDGLEAGDELLVSMRPNGLLVLDGLPEAKTLILVATGTGVGPFVSILNQAEGEVYRRFAKILLVYSGRHMVDLVYHDLLLGLEQKREQLRYVPLVTREDIEGCRKTRVTDALKNAELASWAGCELDESCQFMLCGNPTMIQEMCDLLKEKGLERNRRSRPGNVTIEKYW